MSSSSDNNSSSSGSSSDDGDKRLGLAKKKGKNPYDSGAGSKPATHVPPHLYEAPVDPDLQAKIAQVEALPDIGMQWDPCSIMLCVFCGWANFCECCLQVEFNQDLILSQWGGYRETISEPGLHCRIPYGRTLMRVSNKSNAIDLPAQKMVDCTGTPLMVSAVVVYRIVHSKRFALLVSNAHSQIAVQATGVLREVVSLYPYDSPDGSSPCLRVCEPEIMDLMKSRLQAACYLTGALIMDCELNELSYAPEIAQGMLKRQMAQATVDASDLIVQGAGDIASRAVEKLDEQGVSLSGPQRIQLMTRLVTVIAADAASQDDK